MHRLFSKLVPVGDCLLWTGSGCGRGGAYGSIRVGSRTDGSRKMVQTHRLAYELSHGPIPDGLQVMHLCNNKRCCNPDHLVAGTNSENTQMAADDGLLPWKRISDDDVREIRWLGKIGAHYTEVAKSYGLSPAYCWQVINDKRRRAVP